MASCCGANVTYDLPLRYLNTISSCAGVNALTDRSFVSLHRLMTYLPVRSFYLKRVTAGLLEDFVGEALGPFLYCLVCTW